MREPPHLKPVERIPLSEKHLPWRAVAAVVCLVVGIAALMYALSSYLTVDPGWRVIEADTSAKANVGGDFTFQYYVGGSGVSASQEQKKLISLYTEAVVKAHQIFNNDESFEGVANLYDLNCHPNEARKVEDALYGALEAIQNSGNRHLYLAPVYQEYENLFSCREDQETVSFDPYRNEEAAEYFAEVAAFACDPASVDLELLGDGEVRLFVSDEYLAYARETGFTKFIDLFWMKNAFVADYLADTMTEAGYTHGILSSYDGFIRNLDSASESGCSAQIYDRVDSTVYPAGTLNYTGSVSMVFLRDYPLGEQDAWHYYEMDSGEIRTPYADTADGLCRSSLHNLVCYSYETSCAQVLMEMIPVFIAEEFDAGKLDALAAAPDGGIYSVYCEDFEVRYNDEAAEVVELFENEEVRYEAVLRE